MDCAICLGSLGTAADDRLLSCGHAFHAACINQWTTSHPRPHCPTCRAPVRNRTNRTNRSTQTVSRITLLRNLHHASNVPLPEPDAERTANVGPMHLAWTTTAIGWILALLLVDWVARYMGVIPQRVVGY